MLLPHPGNKQPQLLLPLLPHPGHNRCCYCRYCDIMATTTAATAATASSWPQLPCFAPGELDDDAPAFCYRHTCCAFCWCLVTSHMWSLKPTIGKETSGFK